jgi:hypothetical protein
LNVRRRSEKTLDVKREAGNAVYRLTPRADSMGMDAVLD